MTRIIILTAFLLLLPAAANADMICQWILGEIYIPDMGFLPYIIDFTCWESITVWAPPYQPPPLPGGEQPPGPVPPPPPVPEPPPPPDVWFVSVSDENPRQPVINIGYDASAVRITLDVASRPTNTITPPESFFLLPSLDNMTATRTELVLRAYDAAGQFSERAAHVQRSTYTIRNTGDLLLQYLYHPPGGEIGERLAHYFRGVASDVTYATYDITTVGNRNGRVQHLIVEDALFWNNDARPVGTDPSPYPSVFDEQYTITPSYLPQPTPYMGTQCDPTGRTRLMFNIAAYPDSIARCDQPGEYSASFDPNGTFGITALDGGNLPFSRGIIIGDRYLTVTP